MGVCVNFLKKSFSQTVSEPEFLLSTYNISTDQSKDDYNLETAGDYVLNTLLVVSLVCLFVCLSVLQFSRKQLDIRSRNFASKLHMYISRSLLILVLISQC